jgi:hypothetical protein
MPWTVVGRQERHLSFAVVDLSAVLAVAEKESQRVEPPRRQPAPVTFEDGLLSRSFDPLRRLLGSAGSAAVGPLAGGAAARAMPEIHAVSVGTARLELTGR